MSRNKHSKGESSKRSTIIRSIVAIGIVAVIVILGYSYRKTKPSNSSETPGYNYEFQKHGHLIFMQQSSQDTLATIDIEIADDEKEQEQGLMYRQSMPEDMGMLFIFDRDEMRSFWMKNTYIALDILYINSDGEIITIRENCEPLKEWSIPSEAPAKYVLEVNAGYCYKHGIKNGDRIDYSVH